MAKSAATTVSEYLLELPDDRREVISKVREVVRRNLPRGYEEVMSWGMITYQIPLKRYPKTYNGQPLSYACLAAQKNYFALYLMSSYMNAQEQAWLRDEFKKAGKKLDMGKSCIRFRKLDDLPLEVIGRIIAKTSPDEFIGRYEASRTGRSTTASA